MSNFKILVVEDEVFIAKDIQRALIELGYDVCGITYNSESALKMVYQFQPDLIIYKNHPNGW